MQAGYRYASSGRCHPPAGRHPFAPANRKKPGRTRIENQSVEISATPILDREEIKELLGSDLDGHYVVMNVTVTPKFGKEIDVRRDDFMPQDGQGRRSRRHPSSPARLPGKGALVVT